MPTVNSDVCQSETFRLRSVKKQRHSLPALFKLSSRRGGKGGKQSRQLFPMIKVREDSVLSLVVGF